jgi:hypothetical protein
VGRRPPGVRRHPVAWHGPEPALQTGIEINVVDQLVRKGYRFKGSGTVHTGGDVFERGVRFYEARGTVRARERIQGIVIVAVERALPVTSPAYDLGATEHELRELYLGRLNRSER